jgi:hypothetical protein
MLFHFAGSILSRTSHSNPPRTGAFAMTVVRRAPLVLLASKVHVIVDT